MGKIRKNIRNEENKSYIICTILPIVFWRSLSDLNNWYGD